MCLGENSKKVFRAREPARRFRFSAPAPHTAFIKPCSIHGNRHVSLDAVVAVLSTVFLHPVFKSPTRRPQLHRAWLRLSTCVSEMYNATYVSLKLHHSAFTFNSTPAASNAAEKCLGGTPRRFSERGSRVTVSPFLLSSPHCMYQPVFNSWLQARVSSCGCLCFYSTAFINPCSIHSPTSPGLASPFHLCL